MSSQSGTKINNLLRIWPKGTVVVQSWLDQHDIYRQLTHRYCKNHWLTKTAHGVYIQYEDQVDWTGALYALQKQLDIKIHVGAVTALGMSGSGQYIQLGNDQIWLFLDADQQRKIPTWFTRDFGGKNLNIIRTNIFSTCSDLGIAEKKLVNYSVQVATRERAIMECLHLVPQYLSFEFAFELMDNLRTLRSDIIQSLLECCRSVKVKRLFLYLAETQGQPWFNQLNVEKIDLGSGPRKIGDGGKYIAKYKISIPRLPAQEGNNDDGEYL